MLLPSAMWGLTLDLRRFWPVTLSNTQTVVSVGVLNRLSQGITQGVSLSKGLKIEEECRQPFTRVRRCSWEVLRPLCDCT